MNASPLEKVLSAIGDYRRSGKSYKACCPAHEDNNPSLSISAADDGTVLLKCHSGCTAEAIVTVLGLTMRELFPSADVDTTPRNSKEKGVLSTIKGKSKNFPSSSAAVADLEKRFGKQSAIWTYHVADGQPVGMIVRWDKKGGKIIRPVAKVSGGWIQGGMPTPRPLYRLPELSKSSGPVFVCEGEKAADALHAVGFTVTTSAHGARSAKGTDWIPLAGREVIILPDDDDAGVGYAADVIDLLAKLTPRPSIKRRILPDLPSGGDVADFISAQRAAGLDDAMIRAEIQALVDKAEAVPHEPPEPCTPADKAEDIKPAPWGDPQPIPNDLPPVMAFDYAILPEAFTGYVNDIAERMQCPPDFPGVAIMVALAGVVGKKIGIRPKRRDDWLVIANLWGLIVGRPGIMKTPAIRQPFKFLERLGIEAKKKYAAECDAYEVKVVVAEEQKRQRKEAVAKAVKDGMDPEQAAEAITVEKPKEPICRRYIVNDSTVEKLGDLLNKNPNGLTVFRDEIAGLMEHLGREGQEGARAFYIEAWDGLGKFIYDRIMRGTLEIESVTLSIFGSTQPGRLASYLLGAINGGEADDGMMQRFQMGVYPDITTKWRNIDRWPDTEAKQKAWAVFQAMDALDPTAIGAEPDDDAPFLRFDHDAQNLFDAWRAELEPRIRSGEDHPAIESHLAKYRSLLPSLALLIHLADGGNGPVTAAPTKKAIAWVVYLESHARRIYSLVTDPAKAASRVLTKRIEKGDVKDAFTLRCVYRNSWAGLNKQSSELAVETLIDLGWLKEVEVPTGGKPKILYRINPKILAKVRGEATDKTDKSPPADPFGSNGSALPGHSDEG